MKILIDARVIINQQTGLGNYTFNLIKSLLELDKMNEYTVLIYKGLNKSHPIFSLAQNNLIRKIVNIKPVSVQQQYLMRNILIKENPDLYHYPNWDVPIFHNFKSVFTIHDLTYLLHDKLYVNMSLIKKLYTNLNINIGLKKAKKIIAVSESTKTDIINYYKIRSEKIEVIYENCDDVFKLTNKKELSKFEEMKLPNKYFLFVGERRPHKNLIRIIRAFKRFKENYEDYKLLIVGKRYAQYDEPEKLVQELKLIDEVIFLSYIETETLIALYQNTEALIFTSIYEGFGIPILEAMSCGTPVITSNISATNEIASDAAIKVNPYRVEKIAEAMLNITKDKKLRKNKIKEGLARAEEFKWEKTAEQTLQLYNEAFKSS